MKSQRLSTKNKQQGFGALEVIVALIIISLATAGAVPIYTRYLDRQTNLVVSGQMRLVADAANRYIKDNYAIVASVATPAVPAWIRIENLVATGYLPVGFSEKNAYGQDYKILALKTAPNKLQTLILTEGGEQIKELYLIEIAQHIGAKGGYVPLNDTSIAIGSMGVWQTPLAPYGVSPGAGHLATALFFEDGALVNDYLYRNAVPGQPHLNKMNTAIDMGKNDLKDAATVEAQTLTVSGDTTTTGETYTGGWFRSKGDTGWYNEKHGGGWYMNDPGWVRAYADKGITTGGEMKAGKLTSDGRTEVGEYLQLDGIATEGGGCSPNGLVARNPAGLLLSCQSGVWTKSGDSAYGVGTGFMTKAGYPGYPNRITGGYSCPPGLVANLIGGVVISGCQPCLSYSCSKP